MSNSESEAFESADEDFEEQKAKTGISSEHTFNFHVFSDTYFL